MSNTTINKVSASVNLFLENFEISKTKKLTFEYLRNAIKKKGFEIVTVELNSDILGYTSPEAKQIVANINNLKGISVDDELSIFFLLHEYYHILENKFAPLVDKRQPIASIEADFEYADFFASKIMYELNMNIPKNFTIFKHE